MKVVAFFIVAVLLSGFKETGNILLGEWQLVSYFDTRYQSMSYQEMEKKGIKNPTQEKLVIADFSSCSSGATIRFDKLGKLVVRHGVEGSAGSYVTTAEDSLHISTPFKGKIFTEERCESAQPSIYFFNSMLVNALKFEITGDTLKISFNNRTKKVGVLNFLRK